MGNRKGRAKAVQRVSCVAGSEQGQSMKPYELLLWAAAAKIQNKQSDGAWLFSLIQNFALIKLPGVWYYMEKLTDFFFNTTTCLSNLYLKT